MIEPETIACWKTNYELDARTPEEAAAWWSEKLDNKAPSGAVAALGICLNEIEKLKAENERLREILEYPAISELEMHIIRKELSAKEVDGDE